MALLGKQCWGGAEETQPYDNDCTLLYAAASPLQPNVGGSVKEAVVPDVVTKEQHQHSISTEQPSEDVHMTSQASDPKDVPMDVEEPPKPDTLSSPPVLEGCLDKNFKCPVVILEHDVRVIMSTGFTKEDAEEALVKARGHLPNALGALIRERYDLKPTTKAAMTKPAAATTAAAAEAKVEPRSPLPTEIIEPVAPVSRQEQQKLRDELKGQEEEEQEMDDDANDEDEKPKKPRAKAKAKAKAKARGKAKPGRKAKAKAQPKAKARGRPRKSPSAGTEEQEQEPGKDVKSPTTSKNPGKQSGPKRKRKDDTAPAAPVPKSSKGNPKKKTAEKSVKEKSTFARRFLPKTEPQRSVGVAASKVYEGIKHKLKAPSKLEDWCYDYKPCCTFRKTTKKIFLKFKCQNYLWP